MFQVIPGVWEAPGQTVFLPPVSISVCFNDKISCNGRSSSSFWLIFQVSSRKDLQRKKKLMAGAAGTVRRQGFCNSWQSCVCVIRICVQEGFSDKLADASSKALKSMQIGDGVSEGVEQLIHLCSAWFSHYLLHSRTSLMTWVSSMSSFRRMMAHFLGGLPVFGLYVLSPLGSVGYIVIEPWVIDIAFYI